MERRNFITQIGIGTFAAGAAIPLISDGMENPGKNGTTTPLTTKEIRHMVIFDLSHEKGSPQAEKFLNDGGQILSKIPVVRNFQVFNQVSLKNDYTYGFSMEFDNPSDYATYNNHPDHVGFVENRWKKEVARFMEIDFKLHQE